MRISRQFSVDENQRSQTISVDFKLILIERGKDDPSIEKMASKSFTAEVTFKTSEWSAYDLDLIHLPIGTTTLREYIFDTFDGIILTPENISTKTEDALDILEKLKLCEYFAYDTTFGQYDGIISSIADSVNQCLEYNLAEEYRPEISKITLTIL